MSSARKFDARPKVAGTYRFLDDYNNIEMMHGLLFYARFDHGIISKIHLPPDFNLNEFTIVHASDIPGQNLVPEPVADQPFMADKEVIHFGQIILGIAHHDKKTLKDFSEQIQVEYQKQPATTDIKQCLEDEKNCFGKEILINHNFTPKSDPGCTYLHKVYYTPHQEQAYLETQGMIAIYDDQKKSMFIQGTMQCPYFVKEAVETIMGSAIRQVIVETSEGIGGAFGGKEDFPNIIAGIAALLSYKSGKPVKIVLDRSDDIIITTKRHPARIEIESWTDRISGKIRKLTVDYRLDAGAYQTLSPVVLARGVLHSFGTYNIEEAQIRGRLFRSNTPPNGAFRGFGAPQAIFAIESHIDHIARELGIDLADIRRINLLRKGDEMPTTQIIQEDHIKECLETVISWSDYYNKKARFEEFNHTHSDKKGIGLAIGFHGGGYTGNGEKILKSEVKITIDKDELVKIYVANTDMGQGAYTTLAQIVSEALSYPLSKTIVEIPNTDKAPNSGPTVASRTIYIVGALLQNLAYKINAEIPDNNLSSYIKNHPGQFPREWKLQFQPDPDIRFDDNTYQGTAYKDYSWAACVVEIYYHCQIYQIEVKNIWNVLDIGRPVNRKIAEGQVEGGNIQAMGYALTEFFYKPGFGRMHGFTDYILPTAFDIPEINIEFINTSSPIAKGLGEIPMDYPAPAILNAAQHALGRNFYELPLTPENIFQVLKSSHNTKIAQEDN
ncbi:MAG: xanthine dehydrogenase family protein [Candidatus Cloacimonetes bacterium]|nr:xanthine dehydrogenase family protein [Candidatus Cloacimonadota bacterium]